MSDNVIRSRPLKSLTIFAAVSLCFAMFFASSAGVSPETGRVAVPVSLTLVLLSTLAGIVASVLYKFAQRIQSLESELRGLKLSREK